MVLWEVNKMLKYKEGIRIFDIKKKQNSPALMHFIKNNVYAGYSELFFTFVCLIRNG